MNRDRLFALVDRRACLDFAARMVRYRSYGNTPGESELSRFMASSMENLGLETTLQEVEPGRVQALGTLKGEGGGSSPHRRPGSRRLRGARGMTGTAAGGRSA